MDSEPMHSGASLSSDGLRVAELLCYSADVGRAAAFYRDALGATVLWQSGENMAGLSLHGRYNIALLNAQWSGWKPGQPLPPPELSIECRGDLKATAERLRLRGCQLDEVSEASDMHSTNLRDGFGNNLFLWQDVDPRLPSAKWEQDAPPAGGQYPFVEALLFVEDLRAAEAYYLEKLGAAKLLDFGGYVALRLGSEFPIGLMDWREWFQRPEPDAAPAPPRLVLECSDIAAEHGRLSAAGVEIEELHGAPDAMEWTTLRDPDGLPVTLWQYQRIPPAGNSAS